jgi:hypothetical protein
VSIDEIVKHGCCSAGSNLSVTDRRTQYRDGRNGPDAEAVGALFRVAVIECDRSPDAIREDNARCLTKVAKIARLPAQAHSDAFDFDHVELRLRRGKHGALITSLSRGWSPIPARISECTASWSEPSPPKRGGRGGVRRDALATRIVIDQRNHSQRSLSPTLVH